MTELALHETSGFSMEPFLRAGERIILRPCLPQDLHPGRLVVYRASEALVCHRLVFKTGRAGACRLYVRGDCSLSWPEPVPFESMVGVVAAVARRDGKVSLMDSPQWRLINFVAVFLSPFSALALTALEAGKRLLR
jgi:hypothetical protein